MDTRALKDSTEEVYNLVEMANKSVRVSRDLRALTHSDSVGSERAAQLGLMTLTLKAELR